MNKKRLNEPWSDPFGKVFNSHADLCASYGISRKALKNRLCQHWSLPEALNIIPRINHRTKNQRIDDELTIVRNIKDDTNEPTEYYVVLYKKEELIFSYNSIIDHIRNTLQKTKGYDETLFRKHKKIRDHLGNEYPTIATMCEHYNISMSAYYYRISKGYSIEQTLTGKFKKGAPNEIQIQDYLGQKFESITALCEHYNISRALYYHRKNKYHDDIQKILAPAKKAHELGYNVEDHLGNQFESIAQMCKHHGINPRLYRYRQKAGYSIADSLSKSLKKIIDPFGIKFHTEKELFTYYNIANATYRERKAKQWHIIETLGLVPRIDSRIKPNTQILKNLIIIRNIKENNTPTNNYEICLNGKITTMHHDAICEYCLEILRKEKQDANSKKNQDHASCRPSR